MHVPFVDLKAQYREVKQEVLERISGVLEEMQLNPGRNVAALEVEFAAFCGARYAVGVASGTDALHLALRAYGTGPGDEVITVAHTFVATTEAILLAGATPVFVDVDPTTHTMDPRLVEAVITPRTKAILPVHLYGQTADMAPLLALAEAYGLRVIEDACQAHGALYQGRRAGALGHIAGFSFYCGKNLGAYGEAGMVVTDDAEAAEAVRLMRDHGAERKYHHRVFGVNARLHELQAAVLRAKLPYLEAWNARRCQHAGLYGELLGELPGVTLPVEREPGAHVYHLYVIEVDNRDRLQEWMARAGIGTGIHYPVPAHLHPPYARYSDGLGGLPVSERKARRILSLPMFPELTQEQVRYVASCMEAYLARTPMAQRSVV